MPFPDGMGFFVPRTAFLRKSAAFILHYFLQRKLFMVTILLKLLTFALEYSIIISKYDADHRVRKICVETQKKCKECYYEK